jgi:hypothetical protein
MTRMMMASTGLGVHMAALMVAASVLGTD